jgi:predicted ABC-type ATPase
MRGYKITLLYFWLHTPELAIERVKARVIEVGHHIPEDVIRRRYKRGIYNLINLFIPIVNNWMIVDNSENPFTIIAEGFAGEDRKIYNEQTWNQLIRILHG